MIVWTILAKEEWGLCGDSLLCSYLYLARDA